MENRLIGTVARGVRAPIIRTGDDIAAIVVNSVLEAAASEGLSLRDKDVVAETEAVVARAGQLRKHRSDRRGYPQ